MGYQQKSYKKFVATAATATLVASAIVPVASAAGFSDVAENNEFAPYINALTEAGIINGYASDNTFRPSNKLTRGQVAIMLGRWLENNGATVPADWATNPRFGDVPASNEELAKYAALVKDAGVFTGVQGKLNPSQNITRENMAVVLDRVASEVAGVSLVELAEEIEDVEVKDLKTAQAAYQDEIQALADLEITTVSNFRPKEQLSRAQFAKFLYTTIEIIEEAAVVTADELKAEVASIVGTLPAVNTITAENAAAAKATATEATTALAEVEKVIAEGEYTEAEVTELNKVVADAKVAISAVVTKADAEIEAAKKLAVVSVQAVNGETVEVKFTKPVNKADAEKAGQVKIQGVTLTNGTLSEDGTTLTFKAAMTSGNGAIKVTDATVEVEAIQSKADAKVKSEKYVGKMTYEDKVAPTILNVEAKTNGTVAKTATITLSEPVKAGALVKVNGEYATVTSFTGTSNKLELTGLNFEAGKTHTVEVINAEDKAGNKVVSMAATFTVTVDAATPVATISAGSSDKEILVTFNKPMNAAKVTGITVKDETLANVNVGAATVVEGTNDTQFKIAITDADVFKNKDSRTFSVVLPKDMEDKLGNKTAASVQTVTLAKDTVKPVATGYNVVTDVDGKVEAIEINFSEGLKAASVATGTTLQAAATSIVTANGVLDTATFADFKAEEVKAGDKKVVFKATAAKAITGQFAISFKPELVTDQAEAGNKSVAFNYTMDFGQGNQATEFTLTTAPTATSNVVTVTFPEAVKGGAVEGSATDIANYTLGGKPLPAGTTITLDSTQKIATITLPAESVAKDDQASVFTVANVKNTAGTKTVKSYTGTVAVNDNVAPVLQSAKILDNKTIELTYSENVALVNANVGESFKIVQGTETLALGANELTATVASGFENKLVLKLAKGADAPAVSATATVTGTNATKVTLTNEASANATETVNYKVVDNAGTLELQKADGTVVIADLTAAQSFTLNGVTVAIAGAADGDVFTVETNVGTPATTATVLDLTKDITIETLNPASKVVTDKSAAANEHKKEVKVNVVKP